jgi:uncharacterized membrane protein
MNELRRTGGDYALSLIVTTIAMMALFYLLARFAGVQPPSAAGFVTIIVAAIWPSQRFAARNKRAPAGGEAWRIALVLTVVAFLVNIILASGAAMMNPRIAGVFRELDFGLLLLVAGVVALFCLISLRVIVPVFARSSLKAKGSGR